MTSSTAPIGVGWLVVGLLAPAPAAAFCGTYVSQPGTEVTNRASQIVVAREGTRTTLTIANDFAGDTDDFAMILPIPAGVGPEDVRVVAPTALEAVDVFSSPRLVAYTCADASYPRQRLFAPPACGMMLGCADYSLDVEPTRSDTAGGVVQDSVSVIAAFTAAEYEFVVLSAEESGDLGGWLDRNGYALPEGGDRVLQEYIDSGSHFLAAKVVLDASETGRAWLSPIQISYDSEMFGLPIRIGTISASEAQEVVITVLNDADRGEVGIANYPRVDVERDCMLPSDAVDLASFYDEHLTDTLDEGGAGWFVEHSWDLGQYAAHCDPCTAVSLIPAETLAQLGYHGGDLDAAHLTRLRMRYRPEEATQDLVLYVSGEVGALSQTRFIQYDHELEFLYPICGQGFPEVPGECADALDSGAEAEPASSCNVASGPISGIVVLVGALVRRRRAR